MTIAGFNSKVVYSVFTHDVVFNIISSLIVEWFFRSFPGHKMSHYALILFVMHAITAHVQGCTHACMHIYYAKINACTENLHKPFNSCGFCRADIISAAEGFCAAEVKCLGDRSKTASLRYTNTKATSRTAH